MAEIEGTLTLSFEERLKQAFVPPSLYLRYRAQKELRRGEKEIRLLPFLVRRDGVAIDVGANKGVWTYFLSAIATEVHAFEPNPKVLETLKRGAGANVTAHHIALADTTGRQKLRIPTGRKGWSNQGGSFRQHNFEKDYLGIDVETRKLDDYGFTNVTFIKIDVEGYESEVVRGAHETLLRERPNLVIELEQRFTGKPIEDMIGDVTALGYGAYALLDGVLTPVSLIDFEKHHRRAAPGAYVNNFIFLPR